MQEQTAQIINLNERKFIRNFVDVYVKKGPEAAGKVAKAYGLNDNDEDEMLYYRAAITKEFLRRGYKFPKQPPNNDMPKGA